MKEGKFLTDTCRLSRRFRECEVVDLDKIGLVEKHADLLLICGNVVIVIEETNTMKRDDLDQVISTIDDVMAKKERYGVKSDPDKFVGIVHFMRRVDGIVKKAILPRSVKVWVERAECCDALIRKISQFLQNV